MVIKKNRAAGNLFYGCPMWPDCKVTMPLEAQAFVEQQTATATADTAATQQRLQEMEAHLLRQQAEMDAHRQDVLFQQNHVAQSALAQQRQQEILASAQQQLIREREHLVTSQAHASMMMTPNRSWRVTRGEASLAGADSDVDLSSTP